MILGKEEELLANVEVSDYEILDRANQFRDAADILKKSNKLIPTEVNACFACELYLKYLVIFEKNNIQMKTWDKVASKHDLKELYDMCSNNVRIQIKEKMEDDFENHLEKVKLNFIMLRYDYEYDKVTYSPVFVVNFMETLSEICNCRHNGQYM